MSEDRFDRLAERARYWTSPRFRGYWVVAILLLVASGVWGASKVNGFVRAARAQAEVTDSIRGVETALRFELAAAEALDSAQESRVERLTVLLGEARDSARAEGARASEAILALRGQIVDRVPTASLPFVDSLVAAYDARIEALQVEVTAADSLNAALMGRVGTLEARVLAADSLLSVERDLVMSIAAERDYWMQAYEAEASPGLALRLWEGKDVLGIGVGIGLLGGFLLAK